MKDKKTHWNDVYETKKATEVSWYEPMPETSLELILNCELDRDAAIIDVGGGDSFLAEYLLAKGFSDITVLEISGRAIARAQKRLGEKADKIEWIEGDVAAFTPERKYDLWHDRAAFHFLTEDTQVRHYLDLVKNGVKSGGFAIIGTFSEEGPAKCSGLPVTRYSIAQLQDLFSEAFVTVNCKNSDHSTPSGGTQNFTYCSFQKR